MSPQSLVEASNELYGHPEMILPIDFSQIIVFLGDPAVADFSKHYVEIHIATCVSRGASGTSGLNFASSPYAPACRA